MEIITTLILPAVMPVYGAIVGIAVPILVGWLATQFRKRTGISIEAADRAALQSAITNAAIRVVARSGGAAYTDVVLPAALDAGVELVRQGAPDALRRFDMSEESLRERITDQAMAAINAVPTVMRSAA